MSPSVGASLLPLIGRERDLLALESKLTHGARLITLTGPGGSGKTTLAREVFGRLQTQGAPTYFVDLVGIRDPGLVPAEIAAELGVTETADMDAAGAVVATLRESTAVLVLDNLEELTSARGFLSGLLHGSPGLQIIATSRVPVGATGEVEFQVSPLELPQGEDLAEVEASPAGALFLERARAIGRLDVVDAPTAKAIAELCRRLDGLPLALELAAARTRILPPASILRHLEERTVGILARSGDVDSRHRSLDAVLSWSLDLLEPNEADVLGALAICPGGFDLAIAQALAPDGDVLQAIDALATQGLLLKRGQVEGEPWYKLLETIRSAALERASGDATAATWKRLAKHISERVAGTLEAYYKLDLAEFRRLDALIDNVRAALDWTEVEDPALNLSIASRFCTYWEHRGRAREGIPRLGAAIVANPTPTSDLARAYNGVTTLERVVDGPTAARRSATEAARIARIVGDMAQEIEALRDLILYVEKPDSEVTGRLRELLPLIEHPVSEYMCLSALALADGVESFSSDTLTGRLRDAEAVLAGTAYRALQGGSACNLGWFHLLDDQPRDAYAEASRALSILEDAGPEKLAWVHALRATAAAGVGLAAEAAASLRATLELTRSVGAGVKVEALIATVAFCTAFDAPLLAARAWGAAEGGTSSDSPGEEDRALAELLLVRARRATDPVAFEVAFREGQKAGVGRVIEAVLARLDAVETSSARATAVRLQHGTLTTREVEVLALVGAGKSDAEIAATLFISPKTASVHVSNAKAKLGVDTRLEAALWARERGLVDEGGTSRLDG